ncbi:hypothetical protein ACFV20_00005 [Streptomyces sp. NPDC059696]|uniref:hypothetical protein n=1 Tax=Streptomyces sp. NPDC059696 TaxID=3346911 RepID=UPI0036D1354A
MRRRPGEPVTLRPDKPVRGGPAEPNTLGPEEPVPLGPCVVNPAVDLNGPASRQRSAHAALGMRPVAPDQPDRQQPAHQQDQLDGTASGRCARQAHSGIRQGC